MRMSDPGAARDNRTMARALILSGSGRYSDPWHPYRETSALLAEIVHDAGYEPRIETDADGALRRLDGSVRLVVVNAGDPDGPDHGDDASGPTGRRDRVSPTAEELAAGDAALAAALYRGVGILAMHAAAASLREYPTYGAALGGRWIRGSSWHPQQGEAEVLLVREHPLTVGLDDFTVDDERYTDLHLDAEVQRLAEHDEGGRRHPLVWTRDLGASRLVYDALGHDPRSYASPGHRALLAHALRWLGDAAPS